MQQLTRPMNLVLENIGKGQENIDFIYFATADAFNVCPSKGESNEFYLLSIEEVEANKNIKPHIKSMAIKAINALSE